MDFIWFFGLFMVIFDAMTSFQSKRLSYVGSNGTFE